MTNKDNKAAVSRYLASIGRKGGLIRATKYDKQTLSEWGKKGGRPSKRGAKVDGKSKKSKGRV